MGYVNIFQTYFKQQKNLRLLSQRPSQNCSDPGPTEVLAHSNTRHSEAASQRGQCQVWVKTQRTEITLQLHSENHWHKSQRFNSVWPLPCFLVHACSGNTCGRSELKTRHRHHGVKWVPKRETFGQSHTAEDRAGARLNPPTPELGQTHPSYPTSCSP